MIGVEETLKIMLSAVKDRESVVDAEEAAFKAVADYPAAVGCLAAISCFVLLTRLVMFNTRTSEEINQILPDFAKAVCQHIVNGAQP